MNHVVKKPMEPFVTSSGQLQVHQVLAWEDNLIWLLVNVSTKEAAVVDGPEADGVLKYCEDQQLNLTTILNTHTHGDHIGINRDLESRGILSQLRVVGAKSRRDEIPGITEAVEDNDEIVFGSSVGRVLLTEGHLDGHISFVFDDVLFCGDTMFGAGCGYLFDGPASKMQESLSRLSSLPEETKVCCAHEYTEDNLRFAWSIEHENSVLEQRIKDTWAIRALGECSVPSTIGLERATNPFLRGTSQALRDAVRRQSPNAKMDTPAEMFASTRALKDTKVYRTELLRPLPV